MRQYSMIAAALAGAALALGACGEAPAPAKHAPPASDSASVGERAPAPEPVTAPSDTPARAARAELELNLLGKITPPFPDGYLAVGGYVQQAGGGEMMVDYGRWTGEGGSVEVMIVERVIGPLVTYDGGKQRPRAQIVQIFPVPARRANERLFTEGCSSPDYSDEGGFIYANAAMAGERDGVPFSKEPSAAWRLDPQTARLAPISTRGMACAEVGG
jgi:hypothetical protein